MSRAHARAIVPSASIRQNTVNNLVPNINIFVHLTRFVVLYQKEKSWNMVIMMSAKKRPIDIMFK